MNGDHASCANEGKTPRGVRTSSRNLAQEQILPQVVLHHHGVVLLTIVLCPFSPTNNSRMTGHYKRTLLVVWEVQRAHGIRRLVIVFENKVR